MYCSNCGAQIDDNAVVCVKCGVLTGNVPVSKVADPDLVGYDWLTALLLCWFLGWLGVHSFYTKKTGIGIAQLLTLGGCGIWQLVDLIMIIVGSYRDGLGRPLVRK
ncbi:zinc-ribbon domain and TM2 domain-containing protein [Dinghuibacter silviterrae]|uniref:Zinc ribbon protein n=1 Tax=Dinghuibacter silviterrae TaxID=1539049 RepID=A0A4R8DFS1_9BACT|nr:TM2 domain-containing protein [Dinghuibacter silviterrae]TDW96451.1 zinc ribbon protein [Dinghuibacter silviterrae]